MLRQLIRHFRLMIAGPALFEVARQYVSLTDWLDAHPMPDTAFASKPTLDLATEIGECGEAQEQARQQLRGLLDRCAA